MKRPRFKRLFRISLRTVFVLATVLCVWLGLKVREAKQQKEAVAWVEETRGNVSYDYEHDDESGYPLLSKPSLLPHEGLAIVSR